jgi:hypothetical protein
MDYRIDQLGIQANTGGAILVEGTWYCPALPGPLITATTSLRDHAITRDGAPRVWWRLDSPQMLWSGWPLSSTVPPPGGTTV